MFFKNNPGKIASLKNYNERQHKQTSASWYDVMDDDFRKPAKNNYTKKTIKLLLFSILRCNLFKFIVLMWRYCSKQLETALHQLRDYTPLWQPHLRHNEAWHALSKKLTVFPATHASIFAFPAKAGPHLPTQEEWKAELTQLAGYIPRQFTRPRMVTHPSTNWARCWLT